MVKFIAEICSNHNGSLDRAIDLIEAAKQAGCWGVKFQLFKLDKLFAPQLLTHQDYQFVRDREKWQLPIGWLPTLAEVCHNAGLTFGCTPFYLEAVDLLEPYVHFFKVASYELLWTDLLDKILSIPDKPVILSTGMATMREIKAAIYAQSVKHWDIADRLTILHCISKYDNLLPEDCHLKFITRLRSEVNMISDIGYSDHSVNPGVLYRAINRFGAGVIEFHLDLADKRGWEYEQGHCWTPGEIGAVIRGVSDGLAADGSEHFDNDRNNPERDFRADPTDGLRPLKFKRERL